MPTVYGLPGDLQMSEAALYRGKADRIVSFTFTEICATMTPLPGLAWQMRHMLMRHMLLRLHPPRLLWRLGGLLRRIYAALALLSLMAPASAILAAHTRVSLIVAADTVKPGDTVLAGIRAQMDPGWHTYWTNS